MTNLYHPPSPSGNALRAVNGYASPVPSFRVEDYATSAELAQRGIRVESEQAVRIARVGGNHETVTGDHLLLLENVYTADGVVETATLVADIGDGGQHLGVVLREDKPVSAETAVRVTHSAPHNETEFGGNNHFTTGEAATTHSPDPIQTDEFTYVNDDRGFYDTPGLSIMPSGYHQPLYAPDPVNTSYDALPTGYVPPPTYNPPPIDYTPYQDPTFGGLGQPTADYGAYANPDFGGF